MQVRTAIHVQSKDEIGGWRVCTSKIQYHSNTASLLPIYPTLMWVRESPGLVCPVQTNSNSTTSSLKVLLDT